MKKTAVLCLLLAVSLLSCGRGKGNEESAGTGDRGADHEQPAGEEAGARADKWEGIHYTREELNAEFNPDGLGPLGDYFWDEFGSLEAVYNLSAQESEILGRWVSFDVDLDFVNNHYCFYPNKLFIVFFQPRDYSFYDTENTYLDFGLGIWAIEDNKITARLYCFLSRKHQTEIKEMIAVKPYKFAVIDVNYIDSAGYSKRPFNRFELPTELEGKIKVSDNVRHEYLMARIIYSPDVMGNSSVVGNPGKYYSYLEIVPRMAEDGVSGADIVQSPELIKKYLWDLWP